jgi:UDP-N-acetylglucosamine 2-epimerase
VLSDSGGAAEELPYLGVPLLVYRRGLERIEAIEDGRAVWMDPDNPAPLSPRIEAALIERRWPLAWRFAADSPYGDGRAAARVAAVLSHILGSIASVNPNEERSECLSN